MNMSSRVKSRQNADICADCGAADPTWASVNKGIFLCIECCSIHRSLGRHISQVKSLQKSTWSPTQLAMVQALTACGVNSIWEHSLLDSNSKFAKRKPQPKDALHPVKDEFIRAKHQQCTFVFRPSRDENIICIESELGKQLHSSVRTSNLETSVRLLVQGADPNYFHDEKGSTPLHVAAKANQVNQAELLIVYGADPSSPDAHGKTPIDYAKQNANKELATRLIECQYDVTDKFSNYLCHRKPDHQSGLHFLIPQIGHQSDPVSASKLKNLSNALFEELVMDVYDEVDRREVEAIWLSSVDTLELNTVPFLPVDPTLSTTRNQGRQKLARFTSPELQKLVYDILVDTQRRQILADRESTIRKAQSHRQISTVSDDEPLYDSVASDDDYALLAPQQKVQSASSQRNPALDELNKKLMQSDSTITDLKAEVHKLKALVEELNNENTVLRSRLSHSSAEMVTCSENSVIYNGNSGSHSLDSFSMSQQTDEPKKSCSNGRLTERENKLSELEIRQSQRIRRPTSMYETREGLLTPNWQTLKNQAKREDSSRPGVTQSLYGGQRRDNQVMRCTEHVTKGIQELWGCIQGDGKQECVPCADKIRMAVTNLIAAVPQETNSETVKNLLDSTKHLLNECESLQNATKSGDVQKTEHYLHQVRMCAYEIAKATKLLVTKYPSSQH